MNFVNCEIDLTCSDDSDRIRYRTKIGTNNKKISIKNIFLHISTSEYNARGVFEKFFIYKLLNTITTRTGGYEDVLTPNSLWRDYNYMKDSVEREFANNNTSVISDDNNVIPSQEFVIPLPIFDNPKKSGFIVQDGWEVTIDLNHDITSNKLSEMVPKQITRLKDMFRSFTLRWDAAVVPNVLVKKIPQGINYYYTSEPSIIRCPKIEKTTERNVRIPKSNNILTHLYVVLMDGNGCEKKLAWYEPVDTISEITITGTKTVVDEKKAIEIKTIKKTYITNDLNNYFLQRDYKNKDIKNFPVFLGSYSIVIPHKLGNCETFTVSARIRGSIDGDSVKTKKIHALICVPSYKTSKSTPWL